MIFIDALFKKNYGSRVPIWFMRQAGRYIPEYKRIRSMYNSIFDLINDPNAALEVSMMPIKLFNLDAVIVFSDILLLHKCMGVDVEFHENCGPVLNYGCDLSKFIADNGVDNYRYIEKLSNVMKTIGLIKNETKNKLPIIGFVGGAFTSCCYLLDGGKSGVFPNTRECIARDRDLFSKIIDIFTEKSAQFLIEQIKSGVNAVKVFDSHCGVLNEIDFYDFVVRPSKRIFELVREVSNVPIIGFPRGAGVKYLDYAANTSFNSITIDSTMPLYWVANELSPNVSIQGNLDPFLLAYNLSEAVDNSIDILNNLSSSGFVFNLGHGVLPSTPIENIKTIVDLVRDYKILHE